MKKLILTTATLLFVGLIAFAYESGKRTKKSGSVKHCGSEYKGLENIALHRDDLPQESKFGIQVKNSQRIKKLQLKGVKRISDIISNYPANWISAYVSVEISATCNGKEMKAVSSNDILTDEQLSMINAIDLNTDMVIDINYTYKSPVTDVIEKNTMHVLMTLVPEVEAEYAGGREQMISYLKEQLDKLAKTIPEQLREATIRFTVNEEGSITNAKVSNPAGYDQVYIALVDAIYNMPKWKPAENSNGIKVKQDFEFSVGQVGC